MLKKSKTVKKVVSKPSGKVVKTVKASKPSKPAPKVVKKAATKKVAKPVKKAAPAANKPIREVLNKTALIAHLVETSGVEKKPVLAVLTALENTILASVAPKGAGVFQMPGLFKVVTVKVAAKKMPAIKKGTPVRNPSTGEMMPSKGRAAFTKPATVRTKIRPLAKLKTAAIG